MKRAGLTHINTTKWAIPAGILTLSLVTVIAADAGPVNSKTSDTRVDSATHQASPVTESPAPEASPEITINGVNIPTDSKGKREVSIPGGSAQVEVSEGQTNVKAQTGDAAKGATTNISNDNVDIRIESSSNSVNSTSRFRSSTDSSSNTSVFSDGNSDTSVIISR